MRVHDPCFQILLNYRSVCSNAFKLAITSSHFISVLGVSYLTVLHAWVSALVSFPWMIIHTSCSNTCQHNQTSQMFSLPRALLHQRNQHNSLHRSSTWSLPAPYTFEKPFWNLHVQDVTSLSTQMLKQLIIIALPIPSQRISFSNVDALYLAVTLFGIYN